MEYVKDVDIHRDHFVLFFFFQYNQSFRNVRCLSEIRKKRKEKEIGR